MRRIVEVGFFCLVLSLCVACSQEEFALTDTKAFPVMDQDEGTYVAVFVSLNLKEQDVIQMEVTSPVGDTGRSPHLQ